MARASSPSPRLCLPLLLVVIAAVFVALPVAACASSSNEAAGDSAGSGRMRVFETKKELLGQEGAPSQRRLAFTVGQTTPIPRFASRPYHEPRRRPATCHVAPSCCWAAVMGWLSIPRSLTLRPPDAGAPILVWWLHLEQNRRGAEHGGGVRLRIGMPDIT